MNGTGRSAARPVYGIGVEADAHDAACLPTLLLLLLLLLREPAPMRRASN